MTTDDAFIVKHPQLQPSQDYALLRKEGITHLEKLGSKLWTDYNAHDPGITMLELLCYGITELGYRTGYDMRDILTEDDRGVAVNESNFHTAREIFTGNPVSFDDLRKLLIDIRGVRNAWIEAHTSVAYCLDSNAGELVDCSGARSGVQKNPPLGGLYDVFIDPEDYVSSDPRVATVGLPAPAEDALFVAASSRGIRFDVEQPLTLVAVDVYPEAAGTVHVQLMDADEVVISSTTAQLDRPGEKHEIPLGFAVEPGQGYRLDARGSDVALYRSRNPGWPMSIDGIIRLVSGMTSSDSIMSYYFFYNWQVSYAVIPSAAAAAPASSTVTRDDIRLAVTERLHAHRNLCEDFVNVCELEKEEVALCADIELTPGAHVDTVLARIFQALEHHVSPPVRFYTIDELLAKGKTTDEIFAGPPLDHGFIDDDEFSELKRKCEIRTSDVIRILMDIEGVVAVKSIFLLSFIDGELRVQEPWRLALVTGRFRAPDFSPDRSKVIFYKDDLPYYANRKAAERLQKKLPSADTQSKVGGHKKDLPVPLGEDRGLASYYPIQNELPAAYRTGRIRVAHSAPALRKAQSRQLKAYLMFFEQLLANYLAQLAHVRELFSWKDDSDATYFTQLVTGIAETDDLYQHDPTDTSTSVLAALEQIIEDADTRIERKNRFLNQLIARFAEDFTDYDALMESLLGDSAGQSIIDDKRAFLEDYPAGSGNRGQAYDYRYPKRAANLSGYQQRVYRLLGMHDVTRHNLAGHRFVFEQIPATAEEPSYWRFVLLKVDDENATDGERLFESIRCESPSLIEGLLDFALGIGGDEVNYVENEGGTAYQLVRRCADEAANESIGETVSLEARAEVIAYFARYGEGEGFHVIEHLLLRKRTTDDAFMPVQLDPTDSCDCVEVTEPYSFRMTVLLPSWSPRFQDLKFRRYVEDTLRREAPAHVLVKICWISHQQMKDFETCYDDWADELALLSKRLGGCRGVDTPIEAVAPSGQLPLPPTSETDANYRESLDALIDKLHSLVTVYPLARLHDCEDTQGDTPQVTLNRTSLGTF